MNSILQKLSGLIILSIVLLVSPLYAQQSFGQKPEQPFIREGKILTGFSLSFINASREDFNQEFEREFTHVSVQLDGLYFVSDRIGVGPLLGYRFTYRDLEDPFGGPNQPDYDTRIGQFEFGVKGGWYIPAAEIFGGVGDIQLFVDGGISWLQNKFNIEPSNDWDRRSQFGFQIGSGLLFPMAKRIALETKLGFQARRQAYTIFQDSRDGETTTTTVNRWPKEVALSVGLKVRF